MSWPSGDVHREARAALLREAAAAGAPEANGIVSLEVVETGTTITLVCELVFAPPPGPPSAVTSDDISITGGVRRPSVAATNVDISGTTMTVKVAERGDFSIYELALRRGGELLPGFDPLLSSVPVGFRLGCQQGFDCRAERHVDEGSSATAPIDYLARDYEGFRRLMLDRFAQLTPGWTDPGPASSEVTLIELLAYCADRIAYAQDSVATEAYLDTARRRVSAKRHARLVDYRMSDGCNARTFVHVGLRAPVPTSPPLLATISAGTPFMTRAEGVAPASGETLEVIAARTSGAQIFEAMEDARLSSAHNRILIHDWLVVGESELPRGTKELFLVDEGRNLSLAKDDFLILEEVLDDEGNASPDPKNRHVVRLSEATQLADPAGKRDSSGTPVPLEILRVRWKDADALPISLPIERKKALDEIDGIPPGTMQPRVIARGNMVVVDHGEWRGLDEVLPRLSAGKRRLKIPLSKGPVTLRPDYVPGRTVAEIMAPMSAPIPQMDVRQGGDVFEVKDELFDETGPKLVLDVHDDGLAELRTGDLKREEAIDETKPFKIRYRIGSGSIGNVGAEAIAHLLTDPHTGEAGGLIAGLSARPGDVALVRNPLPARLGMDPETVEQVRLRAPIAFRQQDRAVTGDDYARFLSRDPLVASARAIEQWTGSSRAIVLLVDLVGGGMMSDGLEVRFRTHLERVRLAGHLLEFRNPTLVPIEIAMRVCVRRGVPRDDVERRLMRLFSGGRLLDGSPALFHPDNFSFGQSLRLSQLIAAAQGVDGVAHVDVTSLRRQGVAGDDAIALAAGTLDFGPYEIPLLANDPSFPDRGRVQFIMEGGA